MNKLIIGIAAAAIGLGITAPVASAQPKFCDKHEDASIAPSDHQRGNTYISACASGTGGGGQFHYEYVDGKITKVDGPGSIDGDLTDGKPTPPNFGN